MLWTLIKQTEWRPFLDLLSPSFFRVIPAGPLFAELTQLASHYRSSSDFARAVAHRRATIERAGMPLRIEPKASPAARGLIDAKARGQRVLELYFHQIFDEGFALLDLRKERFSEEDGTLVWSPSGALADWRPEFRRALQALYRGFYRDDRSLFREGLTALGLTHAEDALRAQFGEGQQRAVRFLLRDFQSKFQEVFVRCQQSGARLDPSFLPLGLYLATLYEHLESLEEPFDARAAFDAVVGT